MHGGLGRIWGFRCFLSGNVVYWLWRCRWRSAQNILQRMRRALPSGKEGCLWLHTQTWFKSVFWSLAFAACLFRYAKRNDRRYPSQIGDHFKDMTGWPERQRPSYIYIIGGIPILVNPFRPGLGVILCGPLLVFYWVRSTQESRESGCSPVICFVWSFKLANSLAIIMALLQK